jgi:hypothetical protein
MEIFQIERISSAPVFYHSSVHDRSNDQAAGKGVNSPG